MFLDTLVLLVALTHFRSSCCTQTQIRKCHRSPPLPASRTLGTLGMFVRDNVWKCFRNCVLRVNNSLSPHDSAITCENTMLPYDLLRAHGASFAMKQHIYPCRHMVPPGALIFIYKKALHPFLPPPPREQQKRQDS